MARFFLGGGPSVAEFLFLKKFDIALESCFVVAFGKTHTKSFSQSVALWMEGILFDTRDSLFVLEAVKTSFIGGDNLIDSAYVGFSPAAKEERAKKKQGKTHSLPLKNLITIILKKGCE